MFEAVSSNKGLKLVIGQKCNSLESRIKRVNTGLPGSKYFYVKFFFSDLPSWLILVPRTSWVPLPSTSSGYPLKMLFDHLGDVLNWRPGEVSKWHLTSILIWRPGEMVVICSMSLIFKKNFFGTYSIDQIYLKTIEYSKRI